MFKNRPFLLASLIFGELGFIMLVLTVISFFCGNSLISGAICTMLHLEDEAFTDATMAQIAVVLFLPAFIFAYRSFADNENESAAVPAPAYTGNVRTNVFAVQAADPVETEPSAGDAENTAETDNAVSADDTANDDT